MRQILSRAAHVRDLHETLEEVRQNPRQVADLAPPSSNTGGNPPSHDKNAPLQRVKIDWLAFTTSVGYAYLKETLFCLFPGLYVDNNNRGMYGYPESANLTLHGVSIGVFAWGADHGRDYVSISGKGCQEWESGQYPFVQECLQTIDAKLVRIDHAMDFYKGELTWEECDAAYRAGEFKLKQGGRNPYSERIGGEIDGKNLGRTLYVGRSSSAKQIRCYEKGLEVFARLPEKFKEECTDPGSLVWGVAEKAPIGTIADQWLRVEVQNSNKDRDLALDMITRCDEYFAGAYPFCARILGLSDGVRPETLKPTLDVELERMIMNARNAYGNLVFSLKELGFTGDDIIAMLSTGRHNERLVKSGIIARVKNDPTWRDAMLEKEWDVPF